MATNNINATVRRNQYKLWALIVAALSTTCGGVYYLNKIFTAPKADTPTFEDDETKLEPDLTGAVANTFDGKVSSQVITDAQTESKENRKALQQVLEKLDDIQTQFTELKKENEELKKHLDDTEQLQSDLVDQMSMLPRGDSSNSTQDTGQTATRTRTNTQVNQVSNYQQNGGVVTLNDYPTKKSSFERKVYSKKNSAPSNSSFYIPSGAFSNAIVLEGADANAAVTASKTDMAPMQFKLTGELHLPGDQRLQKLKGCFVTAATYGDISSERAIVRTDRLSCVINGKHIDQPVKGHVAFYGKNGIKGVPVMRNGKILGLAFMSGALSSVGSAVSQIGDTQVGMGASRTIGAGEVIRQGVGGGVSGAANKLADYYIQRAEQYHPVIPIGAANRVEVVFSEGFWAEFIEDQEPKQRKNTQEQPVGEQQNTSNENASLPQELTRQLGEVTNQNLSDFVTPNQ